jgi:hypothetical protein
MIRERRDGPCHLPGSAPTTSRGGRAGPGDYFRTAHGGGTAVRPLGTLTPANPLDF